MTQDILVIIAIVGVFLHMTLAYLSKKQTNPLLKFDYTFLIAAFVAIFGSFTILESLPNNITAINIIKAMALGFAMGSGTAFINNKAPILNKMELKF